VIAAPPEANNGENDLVIKARNTSAKIRLIEDPALLAPAASAHS
jgi:hypothetical protein